MVSYSLSASELESLFLIFFIITGICIGSFANVCIYRLPHSNNIIKPSHCLYCKKLIPFYLNVPIFSYLLLRGKSKCCNNSLSPQYLIVEICGGLASFAAFYFYSGPTLEALYAYILIMSLLIIFFTDLNEYIIPDAITYSLSLLGIFHVYMGNSIFDISLINSIFSGFFAGGIFFITAKLFFMIRGVEGMGMGDVKMIAMVGFWMGIENTILVIILSSLLGSIIGISLIIYNKIERTTHIPFGTFISAGTVLIWINTLTLGLNIFSL